MSKEVEVTLILNEEIAEKVAQQEAFKLTNSIKNLRKESPFLIPPIHITDEIKIAAGYEIRVDNKKVLEKKVLQDANEEDLVKIITADIEKICEQCV